MLWRKVSTAVSQEYLQWHAMREEMSSLRQAFHLNVSCAEDWKIVWFPCWISWLSSRAGWISQYTVAGDLSSNWLIAEAQIGLAGRLRIFPHFYQNTFKKKVSWKFLPCFCMNRLNYFHEIFWFCKDNRQSVSKYSTTPLTPKRFFHKKYR